MPSLKPHIVVAVLACAGAAWADGELTETCDHRLKQRALDSLNGDVSQACKDAVEALAKGCLTPPVHSEEEQLGFEGYTSVAARQAQGINRDAKVIFAAYKNAEAKFLAHAELCEKQRDQVRETCSAMMKDLRTADSNNRTQTNQNVAYAQSQNRQDLVTEYRREGNDASAQLHRQYSATEYAKNTAEDAASKTMKCDSGQAQIYAAAGEQGQQIIAASTGDEARELAARVPASNDPQGSLYSQIQEKGVIATAQEYAREGMEEAGTIASQKAPEVAAKTVLSGVTKAAKQAAPKVAGFVAKRVTGPLGALLGSSSPAGACSEIYYDPVVAYKANCPVTGSAGLYATQSAIQTLSQP